MNEEIAQLEHLLAVGAASEGIDKDKALAMLHRYIVKLSPIANKALFYKLVAELQQPATVKYTQQRANKLKQRLRMFSENDLICAAKCIVADPFLMGDNPRCVKYGTIDYLLRNDEKIDSELTAAGALIEGVKLEELEF